MQACLHKVQGKNVTLLDEAFFELLPKSALMNMSDLKMFENFMKSDIEIEVIRAVKFNVLLEKL